MNCLNMLTHHNSQVLDELECRMHHWELDEYVDESEDNLEPVWR